MKYKGKYVDFQRVRAKKSPKIEMMGGAQSKNYKPEEGKGSTEGLNKETFMGNQSGGPVAPEWTFQLISHDEELMDFDGFNLNYSESRGLELVFDLPMLVTGTFI